MRRHIAIATIGLAFAVAPTTAAAAWPTWGNLERNDCAFAAAANWETVHGGTAADETQIVSEYDSVDPSGEGVSGDFLEAYWRHHGIGGRRVRLRDTTPDHLHSVLRHHGASIAELAVQPGERWHRIAGTPDSVDSGSDVVDAAGGLHFAVVRYVGRRGPVVLTWGQLAQLTWRQWHQDSILLYYA